MSLSAAWASARHTVRKYERYQIGLNLSDLYPHRSDGLCRCGCGELTETKRRTWASKGCERLALRRFWIVKGDTGVIRLALRERDGGVCARCKQTFPEHLWEAHHKIPVSEGGSGCDLDGFETLCVACHDDEHRSAA